MAKVLSLQPTTRDPQNLPRLALGQEPEERVGKDMASPHHQRRLTNRLAALTRTNIITLIPDRKKQPTHGLKKKKNSSGFPTYCTTPTHTNTNNQHTACSSACSENFHPRQPVCPASRVSNEHNIGTNCTVSWLGLWRPDSSAPTLTPLSTVVSHTHPSCQQLKLAAIPSLASLVATNL